MSNLKRKKLNRSKKRKIKLTTYLLVFMDIAAMVCITIFYGPFSLVRDLYVTTAMGTGTHKYLAQAFYSKEAINKVLSENQIIAADEDTDSSLIKIGDFTSDYSSIYEKEILDREEGQEYKLIEIKENKYKGFLVAIYDPSRVDLYTSAKVSTGGEFPSTMAKNSKAKVLINASGFGISAGGKLVPHGRTVQDGKIISIGSEKSGGAEIGFSEDDILILFKNNKVDIEKYKIRDAVNFGPFLVVNGKASYISGQAGGLQPRSAIGQRKDGIVLFLVIDGRSTLNGIGANYADLAKIFIRYGAYNAANLDGGGSATLVIDGKLINNPCGEGACGKGYTERYIPNAWVFK